MNNEYTLKGTRLSINLCLNRILNESKGGAKFVFKPPFFIGYDSSGLEMFEIRFVEV